MKKIASVIVFIALVICANSQTVIMPTNKIMADSALDKLTYNNYIKGAFYTQTREGSNTMYNINEEIFEPTITKLVSILDNGGEISSYKMVIKAPLAFLDQSVNAALPNRTKQTSSGEAARTYSEWFKYTDIYIDGANVFCVTVNITGYVLKVSEVRLIQNLAGVSAILITDQEFLDAK